MRGGGAHPALAMVRISLALFMAGFATFSLIYSAQPLLPEFTAEFGVDPATSSLALSLTTGCLAVSILCVGALSETWGRRGLMFASICGAALLNLVSSVVPTWEVLLVVRSLEGLVLGGVPAVAMAYLSEEIPPDRPRSRDGTIRRRNGIWRDDRSSCHRRTHASLILAYRARNHGPRGPSGCRRFPVTASPVTKFCPAFCPAASSRCLGRAPASAGITVPVRDRFLCDGSLRDDL